VPRRYSNTAHVPAAMLVVVATISVGVVDGWSVGEFGITHQ
jgi:hypothetical protein